MQMYANDFCTIVFGDALSDYSVANKLLLKNHKFFKNSYKYPIFTHQIHGKEGLIIRSLEQAQNYEQFSFDADFILTNVAGVMLGVLTADCLPVAVYDRRNNVIGIAHAGWRGSVEGILNEMVFALQKEYGSSILDLIFTLGPCAKVCCYEVDKIFAENISARQEGEKSLVMRQSSYYFDLVKYNFLLLQKLGVSSFSIDINSNLCTICNQSFHSYRRNKTTFRQVSAISLK